MQTNPIPGATLSPSVICLGTAGMGTDIPRDSAFAMLDAYLSAGGTFLDTASVYSDWVPGESSRVEKLLGRWLRETGNRKRVLLATKGAHPRLNSMGTPRLARRDIESDLRASLTNLQTDVIDLYWLHRDDPDAPVEPIIDVLNEHIRAGDIRHIGCSNWRIGRIASANAYAQSSGQQGFVASQPLWSLAHIPNERIMDPTLAVMNEAMRRYHEQTKLACVPFSSQANGYFQRAAAGTLDKMGANSRRMYGDAENTRRAARVQQVASETGWSISDIVLSYLLSQPFAVFPIIGPKNLAQLTDSLGAADKRLTPQQVAYLDAG